jgi:hypothetical protein
MLQIMLYSYYQQALSEDAHVRYITYIFKPQLSSSEVTPVNRQLTASECIDLVASTLDQL